MAGLYDTYRLVFFPKDRTPFVKIPLGVGSIGYGRVSSDARPFNDRVVHFYFLTQKDSYRKVWVFFVA